MENEIIIYNTEDGQADVKLYSKDGVIWMNQQQMALLFDTSKPNISMHIANVLQDKELDENSVVKDYLTTAADGKNCNVTYYALQEKKSVVKEYLITVPFEYNLGDKLYFEKLLSIQKRCAILSSIRPCTPLNNAYPARYFFCPCEMEDK